MPQEPKPPAQPAPDDVEKFLAEQKTLEAHRHDLIKELLREIAIAVHATQVVGWKGGVRAPKKG